jgi:hypothetical protein
VFTENQRLSSLNELFVSDAPGLLITGECKNEGNALNKVETESISALK